MNSRTTPTRTPESGFADGGASRTTKLAYGSSGISRCGIAVNMSSGSNPFTASSTFATSSTVRQWMPARSPIRWLFMPPCIISPRVVRKFTTLLRDAGPLHDAEPCSQIEHATRFALTDTPEPELVPRGTRSVSYGLHGWPPHAASAKLPSGSHERGFSGPSHESPVFAAVAVP